jgi:hypothetical protein
MFANGFCSFLAISAAESAKASETVKPPQTRATRTDSGPANLARLRGSMSDFIANLPANLLSAEKRERREA